MAKFNVSYSFNGVLDMDQGIRVTEIKKDSESTFDVLAVFQQFANKNVKISISEDNEPTPLED